MAKPKEGASSRLRDDIDLAIIIDKQIIQMQAFYNSIQRLVINSLNREAEMKGRMLVME